MELSIQERLKDLRVERGLTLEQLAEETHLSKSALGSYEGDNLKDISHHALIQLAKFYDVTVDYLLGRSKTKNHPNADLADLRLSDDMIELLKSGRVDTSLLCELAVHPDFPRLMADLEIYVNGTALKQAQGANAIVDTMSATVIKKHNPGMSDTQLRQLITAHIDEDEFCRYVIQRDINGIALALRETHKDDFFSIRIHVVCNVSDFFCPVNCSPMFPNTYMMSSTKRFYECKNAACTISDILRIYFLVIAGAHRKWGSCLAK